MGLAPISGRAGAGSALRARVGVRLWGRAAGGRLWAVGRAVRTRLMDAAGVVAPGPAPAVRGWLGLRGGAWLAARPPVAARLSPRAALRAGHASRAPVLAPERRRAWLLMK